MDRPRRYQLRAGYSNRAVQFHLHRIRVRKIHGTLCQGSRVRIPKCMGCLIKRRLPNNDISPFVGFQESSSVLCN